MRKDFTHKSRPFPQCSRALKEFHSMNVHHLELFYYVAKYEGITSAVQKMPYGIQQPAVSGQLMQLEKALGVKLFNRRPFALTEEGTQLYQYVFPFFSRMDEVEETLRGEGNWHLRVAACASVLRNHLPDLLQSMKQQKPQLKLTLKEVEPDEVTQILLQQAADVAVGVIYGTQSDSIQCDELLRVQLALLVPASIKAKTLEELVVEAKGTHHKTIPHPLISLPSFEILTKLFQADLTKRNISWEPVVEVSTLDVVQDYVARGFGIGLSVDIPGVKPPAGLRRIVLKEFQPLVIASMYQQNLKPLAQWFLEEVKVYVKKNL